MTLDELGNIGNFVAAVGVIISLIYIGIQVKQNRKAVNDNSAQIILTNSSHLFLDAINHPETYSLLRKIMKGAVLTDDEEERAHVMLLSILTSHNNIYYQFYRGNLDPEIWATYKYKIKDVVHFPIFSEFWALHQNNFTQRFQELVTNLAEQDK